MLLGCPLFSLAAVPHRLLLARTPSPGLQGLKSKPAPAPEKAGAEAERQQGAQPAAAGEQQQQGKDDAGAQTPCLRGMYACCWLMERVPTARGLDALWLITHSSLLHSCRLLGQGSGGH